ncbi:O-antigen ligase [Actibacterium sp. 188UL27-1]|uniref:O-antigen ligase family protein n=1 Tax=Actibacterium sp. 188UL27-1 TaxID=2786961 RepID=UPI00195CE8E4|nr:O-antigen ligase family protein [Actibacterium sp. 188UL27-1]MBM7070222.1 O-antigen ligase family protein [Actibacterium sp. 188UL27-1]
MTAIDPSDRPRRARAGLGQPGPTQAPPARPGLAKAGWKNGWTIWVAIFLIATFQPMTLDVAGIYFNGARLICFLIMIPLTIAWLQGKAGRIMTADLLLIAFCFWMILSLLLHQGVGTAVNYGASQAIEIMGPYLLARLAIRNIEGFLHFGRWLLGLTLFVLPFAAFEAVFDRQPLRTLFDVVPVFGLITPVDYGERLGLTRAQVSFEHPILYGVIVSIGFSLAWVALRATQMGMTGRILRAGGVFLATFFSLSSGALASVMVQIILIGWDTVLSQVKKRWQILLGIIAFFYTVLEIVSNRGPIILAISYLTFSGGTAWNRVLIWRYGTDEVWRYPLLGQGLFEDWERPVWMVASIDNYWLLIAMRYGLPGIILVLTAMVLLMRGNWRQDWSAIPAYAACRDAYVFTLFALFISFATVAAFSVAQSLLFFFLGSGVWLIQMAEAQRKEAERTRHDTADPDDDMGALVPPDLEDDQSVPALDETRNRGPRGRLIYSRFAAKPGRTGRKAAASVDQTTLPSQARSSQARPAASKAAPAPRAPDAERPSGPVQPAKARKPRHIERKPRPGPGPKRP